MASASVIAFAAIMGFDRTPMPYASQHATPKLNSRNMVREISRALLRLHTRTSCGRKEIVVQQAAIEPIHSVVAGVISQRSLQKNHAAMESPIATTVARSTGCGTFRARLAEVYPPMAQVTMASRQ